MTDTRVSQLPIEVASQLSAVPLHVSQLAVEIASIQMALIRVSQLAIEIATKRTPDVEPVPDPGGGGEVDPGTNPAAGLNLCPVEVPVAWLEIRPAGSSTVYRYAKVPINIDAFPKEARVQSFGTIRRALSTSLGDFRGVTVSSVLIDTDRVLRGLEDSDSLIGARVAYYLSSEAAIRAGSTARRVFDGIVTDTEPTGGLLFRIEVADYFGSLMQEFAAKRTYPQRVFTLDDFPNMGNVPDPANGNPGNPELLGKPVPVGYGALTDEPLGVAAEGVAPATFVGLRTVGGFDWHEFVVFGHAPSGGVLSVFGDYGPGGIGVRSKYSDDMYGVNVLAPGHEPSWTAVTGDANPYRDYNGNRYTVFYARGPSAYSHITGRVPFAVNIGGVEDVGDGSGLMIDGLARQVLHLLINFIFGNYTSGAWLAPPVVPGDLYSRINTASFEAIQTFSETYVSGGYQGAFIVGSNGESAILQDILRDVILSMGADYGINKDGQLVASVIDPNAALNRAIVDITDVIKQSFRARRRRDELKNTITYRYGKRYVPPVTRPTPAEGVGLPADPRLTISGDWQTEATISDATSIAKYGERPLDLELPMVRDDATADAVAALALEALRLGPTKVGFSERLCGTGTDLGSRDTVTHFEGVTATGFTDRSIRCEEHTLNLDALTVEKNYRDLDPIDFSGLEVGSP